MQPLLTAHSIHTCWYAPNLT